VYMYVRSRLKDRWHWNVKWQQL